MFAEQDRPGLASKGVPGRVERTEGVVGGGGVVGLVAPCRTIGSGLDGVALLPAELEATSRMGTRAPVRPLE